MLISLSPDSIIALKLIQNTLESIDRQLLSTSEYGGITALSTISDTSMISFFECILSCLQKQQNQNLTNIFPFDSLYCTITDFLSHFPLQSRSSLLPPIYSLLTYLYSIHAVTDSFCIHSIINHSMLLSESSQSIQFAEVFSDLLFRMVLQDHGQLFEYLDKVNKKSIATPMEDAKSKKPRTHHIVTVFFIFYFLLIDDYH